MGLHDIKAVNKGTRPPYICHTHIPDEHWPFKNKSREPGKRSYIYKNGKFIEKSNTDNNTNK